MKPMLTLYLTGPMRIASSNGEVDGLSRRAQAMLAYLACQPGMRAERGLLADLLWSDRAEEQARASLRQELAVLRKSLPDGVMEANRQMVWLDPVQVSTDRSGSGDFLQGFDLPSEPFEDWLRAERAIAQTDPRPAPPIAIRTRPAVAVLPFEELGAAQTDMFADGVVEEITGALSRVNEFDVIARQSAFALQGEALDVPQAARRLGAHYIVEGSVRRIGDRVRIAVQLVDGKDGHTLWSERFDDLLDDLFDLQDRIAAQVAGRVSPNLRAAEIDRAGTKPPADRSAYELLLSAMPHFWATRRDSNQQAGALLDAALERDPGYVHAKALRACILGQKTTYSWSTDPQDDRCRALALADAAAAVVDDDDVPSLVALSWAYSQAGTDRQTAEAFIERTLARDPNNAWGWIRRGWMCQYHGEVAPALAAFDRAEMLSPLDPFLHNITFGRAATHYRFAEDPTEGLQMIEAGLRRHPGIVWPIRMLAAGYIRIGDLARARDAAARLQQLVPHVTIAYLRDSLPPLAVHHLNDAYYDDLLRAGIPKE